MGSRGNARGQRLARAVCNMKPITSTGSCSSIDSTRRRVGSDEGYSRVGLVGADPVQIKFQPPPTALMAVTPCASFSPALLTSCRVLVALEESSHEVVGVLTRPDAPAGRGDVCERVR